jgi:hypothetical protein
MNEMCLWNKFKAVRTGEGDPFKVANIHVAENLISQESIAKQRENYNLHSSSTEISPFHEKVAPLKANQLNYYFVGIILSISPRLCMLHMSKSTQNLKPIKSL